MSEGKIVRLVNAAKEFNVGTHTIVEFLKSKGFDVEEKPTTKLNEDMYNVLVKEYQSSVAIKEKADQIAIGKVRKELKEQEEKETKKIEEEEEAPEIIRANKVKVEGPKIMGMIDLSGKKKEEKPPVEEAPKIVVEEAPVVVVEEEKKVEVEEKIEEKVVEPIKVEETKIIVPEPVKPKVEEQHIIRAEAEKLTGPKIMGRIELPVKTEKKPDASSDKRNNNANNNNKGKRKRISTKAIDTEKFGNKEQTTGDKPTENKPAFGNNNNNNRNRNTSGGKRFDNKKKETKPEQEVVSEKEIEEKIKATMAKLSGGKAKSNKSKYKKLKREDTRNAGGEEEETNVLQVTEFISVSDLANLLEVSPTQVISTCMSLNVFVSINQRLDAEIIELVAGEFGYEIQFINISDQDEDDDEEEDSPEDLVERPPIVTIMGHVDHGKTSLLDHIRSTKVVAGEMGGITQHIGAYEVELPNGKKIAFLDTPGHEAFTAMRARGAKLTDIAVIVIAADDNIMPQTREAIAHAQAANVPMIFAINKIDKENANPDKIKESLSAMNILVEDWGGKYQSQEISAKKGINVDTLLDKILLEAEILELKGNANKLASGSIIEASLDKGRGYVTTIMVQDGTLEIGDFIVAGPYYGKVKALMNERGQRIKTAGPSTPVQVLGLSGAPQAGDKFKVYEDESEAKEIANKRGSILREQGIRTKKHITLGELGRRLALGNFKELNIIIKGDVDGSVEALSDALLKLSTPEIQINIIFKGVGQISESDVLLASASDAIIIAFNVRPSVNARNLAEKEDIDIRQYSIIYAAIDEVKSAMEGLLEPTFEEKIVGNIEVREVFKISKLGTIAGCYVLDGKVERKSSIRIIRDGIVVHTGELESLKRYKDDVKEVTRSMECGLKIKNQNDLQEGDIIEAFERHEVKRKL